ncbi:toll/interleukin-1 receptor domain-containing protein [Pedobacter miscanthi]|uniref:toll/interleukin-1 receptor domain-containing protein n=1 Tax=Pedobacter miscanthi TaxID=2259170 RepID=UPI00292FE193|nr:TIR domain-containing protein [Pedobacter miscanthi]
MKVFISWSGETSKNIAEIFKKWLPSVIQVVKPYYSPDDIAKGTRWSSEIAKELDESKVGLICLTKDNLQSAWIMFEAGALSKNIDQSKVCPILFGVDPSDIQGPLVQFQAAKFTKEEVKKVVRMINKELGELTLPSEVFESVFEMWWPRLQDQVVEELKKAETSTGPEIRSERDLLEEVLSLSRTLVMSREKRRQGDISPRAIEDLVINMENIINAIIEEDRIDIFKFLADLKRPVNHLVEFSGLPQSSMQDLLNRLDRSYERVNNIYEGNSLGVDAVKAANKLNFDFKRSNIKRNS